MNMNREVLEEQAKKIQEQAKQVQAGLQTMKNLQKCLVHGHRFDLHVEQDEFHEILQMGVRCSVCGAETELFENIALEMPDDQEKVGDLACLGLDEIDVEEPEEEEEPEKKPTPYHYGPMEQQKHQGDGPYRVDTKRFLPQEE